MRLPIALAAFPVLALACTPSHLAAQSDAVPPRVTRLGARNAFGPGITAVSPRHVQFELTRAAHVIVLRVDAEGGIEPIFPQPSDEPADRAAGVWAITAPPLAAAERGPERPFDPRLQSPAALARGARRGWPPPEDTAGTATPYWLVITSDAPTSAAELRARLEGMNLTFRTVEAELEALPRALVAKRAQTWSAYYAPVLPP